MECRPGCGACCIAISISSPLPGMPDGKKAGERCINLLYDMTCALHNTPAYPKVCAGLTPQREMCGLTAEDAFKYLTDLEKMTSPS